MTITKLKTLGILTVSAVGVIVGGLAANAAIIKPDGPALKEAAALGEKNFDQHPVAFKWDYYTTLGLGYPDVTLRTKYFAVADYVRRSEFQRKFGTQRVHKVTDARIQSASDEVIGGLQFIVGHAGPTKDFLQAYTFSLKVGDMIMKPLDVAVPAIANPSGFMGEIAYAGEAIIDFDASHLKGNEKVTLVVKAPDGRGPSGSKNSPFEIPFDLSTVK